MGLIEQMENLEGGLTWDCWVDVGSYSLAFAGICTATAGWGAFAGYALATAGLV